MYSAVARATRFDILGRGMRREEGQVRFLRQLDDGRGLNRERRAHTKPLHGERDEVPAVRPIGLKLCIGKL